jgi:hypothetical protein
MRTPDWTTFALPYLRCATNQSIPAAPEAQFRNSSKEAECKLHRSGIFVVLKTGVGIECGFDESAYLYAGRMKAGGEFGRPSRIILQQERSKPLLGSHAGNWIGLAR